jgi:mannose-6-phosphate isomerase-like protein (cupin superfamily)
MSIDIEADLPPAVVTSGDGDARWWFGQLALIKAGAAQTRGRYSLVEIVAPPNYATPLHLHRREDEAFWVLEGETVFHVGGETVDAAPGTYLVAPRGVAHGFRVGLSGARLLFLLTPGGFERFIEATSVAARKRIAPPGDVAPPADVAEIARRFGTELVGDLPT